MQPQACRDLGLESGTPQVSGMTVDIGGWCVLAFHACFTRIGEIYSSPLMFAGWPTKIRL